MKRIVRISFYFLCTSLFILGCAKQKSLVERTKNFQISECKQDCGVDSIGVRLNKIRNGDLHVSLGYILNCSWDDAYLENLTYERDTLIIELERQDDALTSCFCFFYFDLIIEDFEIAPNAVRIVDNFEEGKYFDERNFDQYKIEEVEDIEEEF